VYAVDRRGRGESRDTTEYALEREFEDIAALIDCIPGPVSVMGHSHGAICSLEGVLLTINVAKLILYEPPIFTSVEIYPPGSIERVQALVDQGKRDEAVATFFRDVVRAPEQEISMLCTLPAWKARVEAAHTIPRELRENNTYRFRPEKYRQFKIPTLLMLGGDSPAFFKRAIELLQKNLPTSRVATLPGQQHAAMNTAPELFTKEVLRFLLA
jgi:pimeloyl-ACP methyl ester carboxylesterase